MCIIHGSVVQRSAVQCGAGAGYQKRHQIVGARRQTLRDVTLPPTGRPRETFLEADLQVLLICHRDNSCECFPQMALNIDIWADIFLSP